jgi:chromate transport protein ChrA
MNAGVHMAGVLFVLIGFWVLVLGMAALVIAIVALARTFKNAREISNLKSGGTPDR